MGRDYFTGDIDLFTRRPSVVSCEAETDVQAIRLTPAQLRKMDPVVPFETLIAFRDEMCRAQANWQITVYSDAKHSFTGEGALPGKTPEAVQHPQSETRSWHATVEFLQEVLKD
jgi:dienelactone hydrolase